jgi:uncharacterized coiled-coil protein SlyX
MTPEQEKQFEQMQSKIEYLMTKSAHQDKIIEQLQLKVMNCEVRCAGLEGEIAHLTKKLMAIHDILHMDENASAESY